MNKVSPSGIKWGERPIQNVISVEDALELHRVKSKMYNECMAKEFREKYLATVKEHGDVHYFKKPNFGPTFPKQVFYKFK